MKKSFFLLLVAPVLCFGLQEEPWFGQLYEFHFRPSYIFDFYRKIDRAKPQLSTTHYDHILQFDLGVSPFENWDFSLELEFADSTPVSWGYRSFAVQARKLWLDDIACDPISLSTGLVYRDASSKLRRAPGTPYHSRANFEFHTAIGKEWSRGLYWIFRTYGIVAIGQGITGDPWLRGDLFLGGNICDSHQFRLYGRSYWGLGKRAVVPTAPFPGWDKIGHQSIDLGASYAREFGVWFRLRFDYLHRVYAKSYPEGVNFFILSLDFPFCPV